MDPLILTHTSESNVCTQATFLPFHGMNLISYKKGNVEIIDQTTKEGFENRSSGLGPLIGPHFHRRKPDLIPKIDHDDRFPQSAYCKLHGIADFFSHGVSRYVPWKVEKIGDLAFKAEISGKDIFCDTPLSSIEGQNFQMYMEGNLDTHGLKLKLSVVSDTDSLVGIHYYYRLPNGKKTVKALVNEKCIIDGKLIQIPKEWGYEGQTLNYSFDQGMDCTFYPYPHSDRGIISLETEEFTLKTEYTSVSSENSWQLYHPDKASFVCIEPISAKDPRHPNLTVSSIEVCLKIELPA